jgi:hypothetical protein
MCVRREPAHVDADLGDDDVSAEFPRYYALDLNQLVATDFSNRGDRFGLSHRV